MMRLLSRTFRCVKKPPNPKNQSKSTQSQSPLSPASSRPRRSQAQAPSSSSSPWSVYLILSTNTPIKTYVGVTTNFSRRLKQHNGELKGGAKASRAGRPWICGCIIRGFKDRSEACEFEAKWKNFSRKVPRKRKIDNNETQADNGSFMLLQHRQAALDRVKGSFDCSRLEIDWQINPLN